MKAFAKLGVGFLCALVATTAAAQNPADNQIFITPFINYLDAPHETRLDTDIEPGIGVGFGITDDVAFEILATNGDRGGERGSSDDASSRHLLLGLLHSLEERGPWQPYFSWGIGRVEFDYDSGLEDFEHAYYGGVGTFVTVGERVSLRGDLRGIYTDTFDQVEPFAMLGVSVFLGDVSGSKADADGDGIADRKDKCPGTPAGRVVDVTGCEMDGDSDGVVDGDDQCPNTPAGTTVDANGCPPDRDSDGDGVPDKRDQCADTPAGMEVDSRGCPKDSDGDGVPDYKDKCPGSEAGSKVDADGCYIELTESVTIDLNLEFDTNSADLRPDHIPQIRRVVEFMRSYPTSQAVIEGHTDSRGDAGYNQSLSEKRAASVLSYLVDSAKVRAERLSSTGFGETQPKESNDTAEGRQANRRVSAVVSGTKTTRQ